VLVGLLAAGTVTLEALGTIAYDNQALYRYGAVFVEEMFEVGMVSLILYRLSTYLNMR
jgi:hypothetical protein